MAHYNLSNTGLRQRMTQVLVLAIIIIAGIIFSRPAEAQTTRHKKSKQTREIASRSNSNKACYQLYKKRTSMPSKRSTFASNRTNRRVNYKPMAETDQPMQAVSMD